MVAASYSEGGTVCSPASSVMAMNGTPRQILAKMTDQRAFQVSPRKSILEAIKPELAQRPGHDRELAVEQPPEGDGRKHRRHDEWNQHDRADNRLERHVLVEQQREIEPDREFEDAGDAGIEQRVEHREPGTPNRPTAIRSFRARRRSPLRPMRASVNESQMPRPSG